MIILKNADSIMFFVVNKIVDNFSAKTIDNLKNSCKFVLDK